VTVWIVRGVFIALCMFLGYITGDFAQQSVLEEQTGSLLMWPIIGTVCGLIGSSLLVLAEQAVKKVTLDSLTPTAIGLILGLVTGQLLVQYIAGFAELQKDTVFFLTFWLMLVFGYFGFVLGMTKGARLEFLTSAFQKSRFGEGIPKVIDTSVIIDGRIVDICREGFIEGSLVIPRFVIQELQNIADSADSLRRARGRRGLDLLNDLQNIPSRVTTVVVEDNFPNIERVDAKLVELTRQLKGKIVTNDFNLNKVAQIEGVEVLNINDLANALKPAVLPDEQMVVKIIKEGKEANQGVGYLDDGTMVVVDGGKFYIGREVSVVVTSVLQTAAGRMIFAKIERVLSGR